MSNELLSKIDAEEILKFVTKFGAQKLSDPKTLPEPEEFNREKEFSLLGDKLSFTPYAKIGIGLLNAKGDNDTLKISNAKANDGQGSPILEHSSSEPIIYHYVKVGARTGGEVTSKWKLPLTIKGEGSAEFGLYSYVPHKGSENFFEASKLELDRAFRAALSYSDVTSLKPEEALAMRWSGSLGVSASLNWADLVGSVVSKVEPLLNVTEAIDVSLSASIETKLSLSLSDTFLLVFARRKAGAKPYVVELRKNDNREFGMSAKVGVELNTALSKQGAEELATVKNEIAKQLLDLSDPILAKTKNWINSDIEAPEELKPKLEEIREKLLGEVDANYEKTKKKLSSWLDDLENKIIETAKNTLQVSFEWSYKSIRENDTLIRAAFSLNDLKNTIGEDGHKLLRQGKFQKLIDALPAASDTFFLNTLSRSRISSFAFGISLGNFSFEFKKTDSEKTKWSQNGDKNWLPAFTRALDLERATKQESLSLKVGISANGKKFLPADQQTFSNLEFDLSLAYTNLDNDTEADEVIDYIDTARIWNALDLDKSKVADAVAKLDAVQGKLKFICSLSVPHASLYKILATQEDSDEDNDLWGDALALSMLSYKYELALVDLTLRAKSYALAGDYMMSATGRASGSYTQVKNLSARQLEENGLEDLAQLERKVRIAINAPGKDKGSFRWRNLRKVRSKATQEASITALQFGHKTRLDSLIEIQKEFQRIAENENKPLSKAKLESNIRALLTKFKTVRNSRVLFRALGAFIVLKDRKLQEDDPTYESAIQRNFQVFEHDNDDNPVQVKTFAKTQ